MVSMHLDHGWHTKLYHLGLEGMKTHDIMQEILVDVAGGEGLASPKTFRRSFVNWMIDDRRAFPKGTWPKKHAEADRLQTLLSAHPELFV
jgi:hypothetical protein